MTTVTVNPKKPAHPALNRPNTVAIGTVVWLASELMFFAGLFAMYFTLRASRPDIWEDNVHKLNVTFALINTIILVLSSVACQMGVFAAEQLKPRRTGSLLNVKAWGMAEWFVLTFIMGAIFVAGQAYEYATLVSEGVTIASSAYGSAFYITTGFHALHVTAGLVAFLLIIGRAYVAKRFGHYEATSAIVVSYYWHFVDVVWIALFFVVYFVK
ncbi:MULTISPECIES: cytochrome c oxidase subunit 3 [Rothia]|uniref:cytochrome-c oxidase n=2 Tax=Rothia aeria TaxID=172042 RepID=A0A2Z5R3X8_9MICC|nr:MULTISPECIES: heme-copper oxidase subunit III [Rothia]MBF1647043.1 heme-copper oxidase subunit III [Rothia dentocariosa]OXT12049.1 cytochrome B [Rothia sp. Olga]EID52063.1 cytochrome c oxidase, subunit III [Rothia aeria F0474]KGI99807.1 cytochrome B561 [Rothia aeria]KGJ34609.1 cytochrome B561 [Rothia aeria]